jgi:hypothetical protein
VQAQKRKTMMTHLQKRSVREEWVLGQVESTKRKQWQGRFGMEYR